MGFVIGEILCEFLGSQAHLRTKYNGPPRPGRDTRTPPHDVPAVPPDAPLLSLVPSPYWPVSPPAHGPRRLRGALALSTLPVRMLTACRRADAAADTASGRQRQHPVCAKLRLHERWEFLLEQVRRAQLSILSSRCDTHLMNLRSFCSSSSRKTHLFLAKASFAWQWVKFIYINKAQLLVGPVWIKAFL